MNFNKPRKSMSADELEAARAYGRKKSAEFRQRQKEKAAAAEAQAAEAAADAQATPIPESETEAEKVNKESLLDKEGIEKEAAAAADETPKQTKPTKQKPTGKSFRCSCGADIFPDEDGNYPDYCPECGTENDYRGIPYFENSRKYIVCENCGKVSIYHPGMVKCPKCGYGGA